VAHREPPRGALGDAAEVATHALPDRLQGLQARGAASSVDADTFGRAVIDGDEHGGRPWPVQVVVRSVPHIVSTVPGTMLPSCAFGPRGAPARPGASSRCSRISRSTRRREVRTPW